MFKKHNQKVANRMAKFAIKHPQITGAACTIGGINFVYRVAVRPILAARAASRMTADLNEVVNEVVNNLSGNI